MKAAGFFAGCFGVIAGGAILFPVFAQPQELCCHCPMTLSNLKQLGTSAAIYVTDYDDRLFPAEGWADSMMPYMKNEQLFTDPVRGASKERAKAIKYGFAFFKPLAGTRFDQVEDPRNVPLFFQSDIRKRSAASSLGTLPARPRMREGYAMAFADSSARFVRPEGISELRVSNVRRGKK